MEKKFNVLINFVQIFVAINFLSMLTHFVTDFTIKIKSVLELTSDDLEATLSFSS
jgi:hypothetical protein